MNTKNIKSWLAVLIVSAGTLMTAAFLIYAATQVWYLSLSFVAIVALGWSLAWIAEGKGRKS